LNQEVWARKLRQAFSPAAILLADGEIDQYRFKPDRVLEVLDKRWTAETTDMLCLGIQEHGVGNWCRIAETVLQSWDVKTIRTRTCRLLGSQDLKRYTGWKGSKIQIRQERDRNRNLGKRLGCWKNGMLVENDCGDVLKGAPPEAAGACCHFGPQDVFDADMHLST
jgi:hypothetical protein